MTATGRRAWAVGVALDRNYFAHGLIVTWNGSAWQITKTPRPHSQRDILYAATAASATDVWAVGIRQSHSGRFATLIDHFDGKRWSVVPSPNPGKFGNQLYGVAAAGPSDVWAVGQRNDAMLDTQRRRPATTHGDVRGPELGDRRGGSHHNKPRQPERRVGSAVMTRRPPAGPSLPAGGPGYPARLVTVTTCR